MPRMFMLLVVSILPIGFACAADDRPREITDPAEAAKDLVFVVQGEYVGEGTWLDGAKSKVGAQVIALGNGQFDVVVYKGGLPGDGWRRGEPRFSLTGQQYILLTKKLGRSTELTGQDISGKIVGAEMTIVGKDGKLELKLKRTVRRSPTEGAKPPAGAVVLFDGTTAENFLNGKMSKDKNLESEVETKQKFDDYTLHLEFRLSYMPEARGQARSNSGLYLHDCYEVQVLDSFGLEGENNECGGFYQLRKPDVNMCFPPLAWQTYDVEFTAPKYKDGKKVSNAKVEVRHNGVVIHPQFELEHGTPGRKDEGPGPRPFYLQGHGNQVRYRNIWLVPKSNAERAGMDLSRVRQEMMDHFEKLQVEGKPYGCYRLNEGGEADFYAACDVAITRTIMGEDLKKTLSDEQRRQWIGWINSFADDNGVYQSKRHSPLHRNGMAVGALGALGGKQKRPVRLYEEFDAVDEVGPWLEKIDWRGQWGASHNFWGGMHCFSLSNGCTDQWRDAVFAWLDANLDPGTGWWTKGMTHADQNQPLGGGAHIWPVYQHHGRPFPCPNQVIDSILAMQRDDGSWLGFGNYLDLDALYGLAYMSSLTPEHRAEDVRRAVRKHGDLALRQYRSFIDRKPDTHALLAAIGGLGLLSRLDPDRFYDTVTWTDIFSDRRLYDAAAVECRE